MLKGLEISEILLSQAHLSHVDFRIDSEYYSQPNLQKEVSVKKICHNSLGSLSDLIAGPFGSAITTENYDSESCYRYIRATDIKSFFLNENSPVFVKEDIYKKFPQFHLQENDILLTVVGMNFGIPAIILKENLPAIFSCKSTLIRNPTVNPYYLLTYLSTDIGHGLVRRGHRGAAQPGINLSDIENVLVPIFSKDFQKEIELLVKVSLSLVAKYQVFYRSAETLLLNTICPKNFKPSTDLVNIKNFKDSFGSSGRLDAEYYQKKYEDYLKSIRGYKFGYEALKIICDLKDVNYNPEEKIEYKYIELADIGKSGDITGCTVARGAELPTRARRIVKTNDVIVSSIEGSLDSCALISKEYNNALCSTGFYVINSKKINSETLLVLFKSEPMQKILKQNCSGTILTAINKTEFQNIPIPNIETAVQKKIKEKIIESSSLKKQSQQLLEKAKRAVEIAIEETEDEAIKYIKDNNY